MLSAVNGTEPPGTQHRTTPLPPRSSKLDQAMQKAQQARSAADGKPIDEHADQTPVVVTAGDTLSSITRQHDESRPG